MQMNDMVLISADDHICEPPNMFENQLSGALLASAPKKTSPSTPFVARPKPGVWTPRLSPGAASVPATISGR